MKNQIEIKTAAEIMAEMNTVDHNEEPERYARLYLQWREALVEEGKLVR